MSENKYVAYEYTEMTVKRSMEAVYADSYESFGWSVGGTSTPVGKVDSITMKFKRDRKIPNKAELTRLQRQFDAYVGEIVSLEQSKYSSYLRSPMCWGSLEPLLWQAQYLPWCRIMLRCVFSLRCLVSWGGSLRIFATVVSAEKKLLK